MKNALYTFALAIVLTGCANAKKEEIAIQKQVLDTHDQIMAVDIKASDTKLKLDSMIQKADSLKLDKQAALIISAKLAYADNAMSDWMGKLNHTGEGENHDAIMTFWRTQQAKAKLIDSLLNNANTEAEAFIQKATKK